MVRMEFVIEENPKKLLTTVKHFIRGTKPTKREMKIAMAIADNAPDLIAKADANIKVKGIAIDNPSQEQWDAFRKGMPGQQ